MVDRDRAHVDDTATAEHPVQAAVVLPEPAAEQLTSVPRLARGLRWSDIVAEIERENDLRDAA